MAITKEQAIAELERRKKIAAQEQSQKLDQSGSFIDPLGQGVSFGFADEIAGLTGATLGKMLPESLGGLPSGTSFGEAYEGVRDMARWDKEAFERRNPKTALGLEVAGGLATGGLGLAKAAPTLATKVGSTPAAVGLIGAAEGGLAGAGTSKGDNLVSDTAKGAALGGALGYGGAKALGGVKNWMTRRSANKDKLKQIITQDPQSADVAGLALSGSQRAAPGTAAKVIGVITPAEPKAIQKFVDKVTPNAEETIRADDLAKEALRQGFDPGVIAPVQQAAGKDADRMLQMAEIMQKGRKNKLYQLSNRPADIPGQGLHERVKHVIGVNRAAGKEVGKAGKDLKGQTVPFDDVVGDFVGKMENSGINLELDDAGNLVPNFQGSDIEGLTGVENVISNVVKRMRGVENIDAYSLHQLKRFIDENVSYGKRTEGLSGRIEGMLKSLRRGIDQRLDETFPAYDAANIKYKETREVIDALQTAVGNRLDLTGDLADKALGQQLRKLMSNYQSRTELLDAIPGIEDVANKYGGKFDDDLLMQALFADELNNQFGVVARTSLAGEVGKGAEKGIEAVSGGLPGAVRMTAAEAIKKAQNINEDAAFDAIIALLKRQRAQQPPRTDLVTK